MANLPLVKAKRVIDSMNKRLESARRQGLKAAAVVGYTQNYALFVHERLDLKHPVGKAKYLTDPFEAMKPVAAKLIQAYVRQGKTLKEAVLLVALEVQSSSQEEVPVDTGALKASAFTREETV